MDESGSEQMSSNINSNCVVSWHRGCRLQDMFEVIFMIEKGEKHAMNETLL